MKVEVNDYKLKLKGNQTESTSWPENVQTDLFTCTIWAYFVHLNFQHIKISAYLFLDMFCGLFVFQSGILAGVGFRWHIWKSCDLLLP